MNKAAYFLEGMATVSLSGIAKVMDSEGKIIKEVNLSNYPVAKIPFEDALIKNSTNESLGITIIIDDIL